MYLTSADHFFSHKKPYSSYVELYLQRKMICFGFQFWENLKKQRRSRTKVVIPEREGRCFSSIVARRNYNLCHGVGRSGDISAVQPKAAGSSLILTLTNQLAQDAIKIAGIKTITESILLPLATSMALCFCFMALRQSRPRAKFVVFLRIDQKACFKTIFTAGFEPIVVNGNQNGDEIQTNLEKLQHEIQTHGPEAILCVLSTTSCFAPRVPDNLPDVGKLCKQYNVPHIVNNAYGLQSTKCAHLISETHRLGFRIDAFVQSMDKNFGVPVGGSIVAGFGWGLTDAIGAIYPGRASAGWHVQFIKKLILQYNPSIICHPRFFVKISRTR